MAGTIAQDIQYKLTNGQLRATLFAVQLEAARYKYLPKEDLPIEITTLLRARSTLANIVHGIGEPQTLLLHEWQIFYTAMNLEVGRYASLNTQFPRFVVDLIEARMIVGGMLSEAEVEIRKARVGS